MSTPREIAFRTARQIAEIQWPIGGQWPIEKVTAIIQAPIDEALDAALAPDIIKKPNIHT